MKNVTKILTIAVLTTAIFASAQRTSALGDNAAFWPGDEANINNFPAQINNHGFVQFDNVGNAGVAGKILFNHEGTAWSFGFDNDDNWFNLGWGKNGMGINAIMANGVDERDTTGDNVLNTYVGGDTNAEGFSISYGNSFDWGELGINYNSLGTNTDNLTTTVISSGVATVSKTADSSDSDAGITVNFRRACDFWVFDSMVARMHMPENDELSGNELSASWFTHMDAGGADVMFAMGISKVDGGAWEKATTANTDASGDPKEFYCMADASNIASNVGDDCFGWTAGTLSQTAAVGVEANMTDWATLRAGLNWEYVLSGDNDGTGSDEQGWGWAAGLGFNWGGFAADFDVAQSMWNNPIGTMTGFSALDNNANTALDTNVTLTYSF